MLPRILLMISVLLFGIMPVAAKPLRIQIEHASIVPDQASGFGQLQIDLAPESAAALTNFTTRHVGKIVEMRVDGKVVMRPMIQTPIMDRVVMVTGYSMAELRRLAERINSGAASVELVPSD